MARYGQLLSLSVTQGEERQLSLAGKCRTPYSSSPLRLLTSKGQARTGRTRFAATFGAWQGMSRF